MFTIEKITNPDVVCTVNMWANHPGMSLPNNNAIVCGYCNIADAKITGITPPILTLIGI